MAATRSPGRSSGRSRERRRQRSVRVTVAVSLLSVATVAVLVALPTQSAALLSVAAVAAVGLGWAAVRIVWTEVLQSRRENAADRAAAARAYRSLFTERAAEHAEFTSAMTERLAASTMSLRELQGALVQAQAETAGEKLRAERAEAAQTQSAARIAELEQSIAVLNTEIVTLRSLEGIDDLMAFDEKVADAVASVAKNEQAETA